MRKQTHCGHTYFQTAADRPLDGVLKFLCDHMLVRMGKWLRTAGYDTAIAVAAIRDSHLLDKARAEGRIFLTCDRRLIREREIGTVDDVVVLSSNRPETAAPELANRLHINWLYRPFSRCTVDNSLLAAAGEAEMWRVPDEACPLEAPVMTCPRCHRVYWHGSHHRRMLGQLIHWHEQERSS